MPNSELQTTPPPVGHPLQCVVTEARGDGLVEVRSLDPRRYALLCEVVLAPDGSSPRYGRGDRVVVVPPASEHEYACIVGRVGRMREEGPRRIDLEAGEELVLRCGKGSITLRADGRILIRGLDIVSKAAGRNRVKGGVVEIN